MRKTITLLILLLFSALVVQAQDLVTLRDTPPDGSQYHFESVASGFGWPIYMTNAGDGSDHLFLVEQTGSIYIIDGAGNVLPTPFINLENLVHQNIRTGYTEMGLLGLEFHPDYANNGQFFVHYYQPDRLTVISRYQVSADDPNVADPNSAEILFTHEQPNFNHNGGQIEFGPDGYLYIALGDGGAAGDPGNRAQNPQVLLGKILRIDVDGDAPYTIPPDNPISTVNPDLAPEIWAFGLRNPWRFSFDSATGDLYIADVGQNQWEEINFQAAGSPGGRNYGWRIWEGEHRYSQGDPDPGDTVFPIAEYSHNFGCSVTGGYVYRGEALLDLQGAYIFGDYCSGRTWASYRNTAEEWITDVFMETGMQISSFGIDEAGELYVINYSQGEVLKLVANE